MVELKLNDEKKAEMTRFYEEELDKTVLRLRHIAEMLQTLDPTSEHLKVKELEGVLALTEAARPKRSSGKKKSTRKKKPGPKGTWTNYIMKRLRQVQRPITYEDLIHDAMLSFNKPKEELEKVRQAVMNSAFRLRKKQGKVLTYRKPGSKEKYIGLRKWFDETGTLLEEYKKKILD